MYRIDRALRYRVWVEKRVRNFTIYGYRRISLFLLPSLVNLTRYKKVGYLDTDVGQLEFSPPGFLSLPVLHEVTPGVLVGV
ncbi:hypothetical protein ABKV19_014817 [Rosa sericea]